MSAKETTGTAGNININVKDAPLSSDVCLSDSLDDDDDTLLFNTAAACEKDDHGQEATTKGSAVLSGTDGPSPLERFRPGYLWVSDLTKQIWCEQQLLYSFTVDIPLEKSQQHEVSEKVKAKGTDIHLARELAVHDVVQVTTKSREDAWAIKLINLLSAVQNFLNGVPLAREVPIFGCPFEEDIFIVGLIDELTFDLELYSIGLSELKTRMSKSRPSKAQELQHEVQVMMYKKLFDDMVKGRVQKKYFNLHLKLNLSLEFGEAVSRELEKLGIDCKSLGPLLETVFNRMQVLTCINELSVEYVHQDTHETLHHHRVHYDDHTLRVKYKHCLQFWRGQRSVVGVEIEEAWKCHKCDFASLCEWRMKKSEDCVTKNNIKGPPI